MKTLALAAAVATAFALPALAEGGDVQNDTRTLWERHQQDLYRHGQPSAFRPVQSYVSPGHWQGPPRECWNPRAGHYEGVRENEFQDDLDFSRCRLRGGEVYGERYYEPRYDDRAYAYGRRECWNPRAGHFEGVREGEYQDDLDYSRCRVIREERWPGPYYGRRIR